MGAPCHEGGCSTSHEGDEEEGSDEAPRHEGSGCGTSHEGHAEEGSNEAPRHEGSCCGTCHEGYAEEGSHEAPRHEGSGCSTHEGHEEVKGAPCPQPHMISVAQAADH